MKNKKGIVFIGLGLLLIVVSVVVFFAQKPATFTLPDKESYTFDEITGNQMQKVKYITSNVSDEIDIPYLLNTWGEKRTYIATDAPDLQTQSVMFYFHKANKDVLFAVRDISNRGLIQVLINDKIYTYKVVENDE